MNRFKYPRSAVDAAIKFLKSKKGPKPAFIEKFPGSFKVRKGKLYADGKWVVPTESREDFLREIVYGKKSEYPFGRDSLFEILKHEVMNVSKRDIESFLNAQGPFVHRRARPKKEKREHMRSIKKPGILSVDLAHIKSKDFVDLFKKTGERDKGHDYMGAPGSKGYQQDRYFLNAVDLLTGYLLTDVLQGKKPEELAPKLKRLIERFEEISNVKVRQVEIDKGGEFMGKTSRMFRKATQAEKDKKPPEKDGPFWDVRLIQKTQNATVEQTNAKMQRIFWNLVEQRRGGFETTWKQAVKISNRTRNRRTGINPEQAMKNIVGGINVKQRTPKAGATERKKAFAVGTNVRALKEVRAKGDSLGYKAYKGNHYGPVYPIAKVKFIGVHPRYKVDKKWVWGDELIRARPTDSKSQQLILKRPVIVPKSMRVSPKKVRKVPKGTFEKNQYVWFRAHGRKLDAFILTINTRKKKAKVEYEWLENGKHTTYTQGARFKHLEAQRQFDIGDKVKVNADNDGIWRNGEVEDYKNHAYITFYYKNRQRLQGTFRPSALRPR
jgi:hypothetical protein